MNYGLPRQKGNTEIRQTYCASGDWQMIIYLIIRIIGQCSFVLFNLATIYFFPFSAFLTALPNTSRAYYTKKYIEYRANVPAAICLCCCLNFALYIYMQQILYAYLVSNIIIILQIDVDVFFNQNFFFFLFYSFQSDPKKRTHLVGPDNRKRQPGQSPSSPPMIRRT